jgi:hypothetical protein
VRFELVDACARIHVAYRRVLRGHLPVRGAPVSAQHPERPASLRASCSLGQHKSRSVVRTERPAAPVAPRSSCALLRRRAARGTSFLVM